MIENENSFLYQLVVVIILQVKISVSLNQYSNTLQGTTPLD